MTFSLVFISKMIIVLKKGFIANTQIPCVPPAPTHGEPATPQASSSVSVLV